MSKIFISKLSRVASFQRYRAFINKYKMTSDSPLRGFSKGGFVHTSARSDQSPQSHLIKFGPDSMMKVSVSSDGSSMEANLPGWSAVDINVNQVGLDDKLYLRIWHIIHTSDWIKGSGQRRGFLDMAGYEKTHFTYFKCLSLERCISCTELEDLGGSPYQYRFTVKSYLSRIGKTSFQIESDIYLKNSDKLLFKNPLVAVCVSRQTREVTENPQWWVDKYKKGIHENPSFTPLRVDFTMVHAMENHICTMPMIVQPTDLDYYGHANNTSYITFAMNGILAAQIQNKLPIPMTIKQVNSNIKYIEVDFISDCSVGDMLEAKVYKDSTDTGTLYVELCKNNSVIYRQKVQYENITDPKPNF